ncbi:hypothetical protein CYFUS_002625 [Cystobacter fuscus]|uniref:Uncharacterized protein n=1 Tax=Cystobacter fuscus TaxID=43 RepID=A0A250IZQ8_9BACT|nr:hypothetical protein [Cystobacter fuscus]ATB37204.1 hypothetical protein CYFUS_002625 [Cystobacter fuscus]
MFKLTSATFKAMSKEAAKTFPDRLLAFIREHLPEKSGEGARAELQVALVRGRWWGLTSERELAAYAVLAFIRGMHFDEEAWIKQILEDASLVFSERLDKVYEQLIREAVVADSALARGVHP